MARPLSILLVLIYLLVVPTLAARPSVRTEHGPSVPNVVSYTDLFPDWVLQEMEAEALAIAQYERDLPALRSGKYRTRWLAGASSSSFSAPTSTPSTVLETVIARLREYVRPGPLNAGAEWWLQVVEAGPAGSIGWHVDKDESVASNKHYLSHPEFASIFYLSDHGGATVITDQWSPFGNGYEPEQARTGFLSRPKRGKYTVFKGELLHGVLPGPEPLPAGIKRVTFLVNWWNYKPEEPNCSLFDPRVVPNLRIKTTAELDRVRSAIGLSPLSGVRAHISPKPPLPIVAAAVDLTPGSQTRQYLYEFRLPGGTPAALRMPSDWVPGETVQLFWHDKPPRSASLRPQEQAQPREQERLAQGHGHATTTEAADGGAAPRLTAAQLRDRRRQRDREL